RDYLFIPLGGSRDGLWRTLRNFMITMTLGGLWHGASWTFVVWGVLHGLLLCVHRLVRWACEKAPILSRPLETLPGTIFRMALTFFCVAIGWIFFRSQDFTTAATMLERMFVFNEGIWETPFAIVTLSYAVIVLVVCHALTGTGAWKQMALRLPPAVLGFGYMVIILVALVLAPEGNKAFIYFQF